jgi:hypothetical protein
LETLHNKNNAERAGAQSGLPDADADRPVKWYFALKQNLTEERRTGVPVLHPMAGPATLHWRS